MHATPDIYTGLDNTYVDSARFQLGKKDEPARQ